MDKTANINDSLTITDQATVSARHYLSSEYLWTALQNARWCLELEKKLTGKVQVDVTHRSHAMTAVLSSVAFLESFVNEIYSDAADHRHDSPRIAPLATGVRAMMEEYWVATNQGVQGTVLSKYSMALLFAGAPQFDKGAEPYQSAEALINLRNALMHFKPTWHDQDSPNRLASMLRNRIKQSGLLDVNDGSPWVPIKALGASCAEWAPITARAMTDAWTTRLGIPRVYEADLGSWDAKTTRDSQEELTCAQPEEPA